MAALNDPELETLALAAQALPWPADGGALVLCARSGPALMGLRARGLWVQQSFKPRADALARDGYATAAPDSRHGLVMLLAPRQRDEARARLAEAVARCLPGGRVLACAANNAGGRSLQDDLARLCGPVQVLSKHHCRASGTAALADAAIDADLLAAWRALDAPRPILDGRFRSRPGLFAWDRVDAASALLAESLPVDLAGAAADLGGGWGYLSHELLARCPGITALDLFEAEARALDCARDNLAGARLPVALHWHDVTTGLPGRYDVVVSNPPFHQSRADEPALGQAFLAVAAAALRPGGRLLLVANRHLPYEAGLARDFARTRVLREAAGFKVIEAVKA